MNQYSFSEFDELAHWFWTFPLKKNNERIEKGHIKDSIGKSGITLVLGCPLPHEIQQNILRLQRKFEEMLSQEDTNVQVRLRQDLSSLHVTIYGLVKPEDYKRDKSWPLSEAIMDRIKRIVSDSFDINIYQQGLGILGGGALAIRTSNSDALTQIRDEITQIEEISEFKKDHGEGVNKVIIGRLLPISSDHNLQKTKKIVDNLKDFDIGEVKVTHFELVHYKHEFLDRLYGQNIITPGQLK